MMKNYKIVCSFLVLVITGFYTCLAQKKTDSLLISQFENSFALHVPHPSVLYVKSIPILCLLRFEIDSKSKISNWDVSDSADTLFVKEIKKNINTIDLAALEKYCENRAIKDKAIIIPVDYYFPKNISTPQISADVFMKYNKFNGQPLTGDVLFLKEISIWTKLHDYK